MAKTDVLDILRAKKMSPLEFDFDSMWIPPINFYLTQQDIDALRQIATSIRLSSKIQEKYRMIDAIMRPRGFKRFSAGTNRVVYSFLEDIRFVVKIAVDKVGMQDNPMEYQNQFLLKPYVAKTFYVSPCGTVGFAERVLPIKNKEEFKQIAADVFDILVNKVLGKYVVEDVGTKYFMNYGVRRNFAPVLLDYPYIFKLDGRKLYCNKMNPETGIPCDGEIDYDAGFNHLVCTRCGKTYLARDLQDDSIDNKIIIKGGTHMKIVIKEGDKIVSAPIPSEETMTRPVTRPSYKSTGLVVAVKDENGTIIVGRDGKKESNTNGSDVPDEKEKDIPDSSDDKEPLETEDTDSGKDDTPVVGTEEDEEPADSNPDLDDCDIETPDETADDKPEEESIPEKHEEEQYEKHTPLRDDKGRFISTGKVSNKKGKKNTPKINSTFIPASK